jgi:hypothetical protein
MKNTSISAPASPAVIPNPIQAHLNACAVAFSPEPTVSPSQSTLFTEKVRFNADISHCFRLVNYSHKCTYEENAAQISEVIRFLDCMTVKPINPFRINGLILENPPPYRRCTAVKSLTTSLTVA